MGRKKRTETDDENSGEILKGFVENLHENKVLCLILVSTNVTCSRLGPLRKYQSGNLLVDIQQ